MQRILRIGVGLMLSMMAYVLPAHANTNPDSTRLILAGNDIPPSVKEEVYRTFEGLGTVQEETAVYDPIILPPLSLLADSTLEQRAYAQALLDKVISGNRFFETLNDLSEIDLPIGIVKPGGSFDYSILIDRMTVTTQGAMLDVYVSLALPHTGDQLAFHGKIPLSAKGGIAGNARVFLVGDHSIKFSGTSLLVVKGNKNTYVEFDCNGFVGVSLEAEVQFSQQIIVPEDEKGDRKTGTERVVVNFVTYASSLNDIKVGVTIPPFQVTALKGFGFTVTQAVLDWSDKSNPTDMVFPKDYTSPFLDAGQPNLWQGFYLKNLEVRLPKAFTKNKGDAGRIIINVDNMLLDNQGFTGQISVQPVLDVGKMSSWSYSIDKLGLGFVTNQIKGFEIAGSLTIPVIKSKDDKPTQFGYRAQLGADGNYIFAVSINSELKFPLFVADLTLVKGSSVIVKERDNKFYPTAILNGELFIKALGTGPKAVFNNIQFEGLRISTEAPHFDLQAVGFGKEGQTQSVSKYPLVINNIMLRKDAGNRIGIGFDVTINISGKSEDGGFGGTAALVVWGKQEPSGEESSSGGWKFDKVELSGIGVNFKKPGVIEIAGMIRFFDNDPVYGDGFKGSLSGKIQVIKLKVEALFGKTPEYRYWFADAMVEFESGLPLMSGISAYGFGGGFYSKMKQSTSGVSSPIGQTASGVTYIPDANSMGIKAMVKFGATGSQTPYNGDVTLEVAMNRHGGINSVTFTGNIRALTPPPIVQAAIVAKQMIAAAVNGKDDKALDQFMDPSQAAVMGHVKIFFDNENDLFHANMEMYVNVLGGIVKGVGAGNKAGWAVMHFEKNDWYFLVGTPNDPVGLEILWMLKVRSYFMLGKHLPGSPPPPHQVSEILGISSSDLDYMRDLNALESGMGFAFGLNLSMDTGNLRFLMFYGRFQAGIGTDIMLKQYGKEYHCVGSDDPIGINGWYANGQAYAYVQGKIGIRVKLRFYRGNFDILSIGAAAVLQAKGPNPFWMRGIVGGYYRILGGLIKGRCKFSITIGKDCQIVGNSNPLDDVRMIAGVSPEKNQNDVDVFTAPQVAFNIPIGKIFEIKDIEGRVHTYRGYLDEFSVLNGTEKILGSLQWNDDSDVVIFNSRDILPGEKKLKAKVKLTFEEYISGVWTKVKFEGQIVEELEENEFTTGKAPDYIPGNNVLLSYPLVGQANFYPKEHNEGWIQLKQGQAYLFEARKDWVQKIRMTDASSQRYVEGDFSYNANDKKVNFTMPSGFENAKVYRFEILSIPVHSTVIDANVQKIETEVSGGEDGTATLTTKQIEGELENLEIKSIYTSTFRTSRYNTFVDKMKATTLGQGIRLDLDINVFQLAAHINGEELWDEAEINGLMNSNRLIEMVAILTGNNWYENYVYPLVYEGYPMLGKMTLTRRPNPQVFGIPPIRDIYFENLTQSLSLRENETSFTSIPFSNELLAYNLNASVFTDYKDIQRQVVNYVADHPYALTPRFNSLIVGLGPYLRFGTYKLKVNYVLPGTNKVTSSYEWQLSNIVPDRD
jgi:hypothetical protein